MPRVRNTLTVMVALAFTAVILPVSAQQNAVHIACIDMQKVFKNYHKTRESGVTLEKDVQQYRAKAKRMMRQIKTLRKQYRKLKEKSQNVGLTEEQKQASAEKAAKTKQQLTDRIDRFRQFRSENKEKLDKQYLKKRNRIVSEIQTVVAQYADENNIELVLDTSGMTSNMIPPVVYSADALSITGDIIQRLNKDHQPDESAQSDSSADTDQDAAADKSE